MIENPDYDENGEQYWEEEPILLELAIDDDGELPSDSSWMGGVAGASLSIVFHLWLIFTLSGIDFADRDALEMEPIQSFFTNPPPPEPELETKEFEMANPDDRETEFRKAINARSIGMEFSNKPMQESAPVLTMDVSREMKSLPKFDIPQGKELSKKIVVPGTTGEALIQLDTALDRVTWEIAQNLQERKVLVVWMIDASGSVVPQRQTLIKRLRRIYSELGQLESAGQLPRVEQPLLSGVVLFGATTTFITKEPTDKFDVIVNGIQSAPTDPSGLENVFTSVSQVMDNWGHYRVEFGSRQIMLIVLTDEAGDDHGPPLETAINKCHSRGAKAYVIGPAAPLGRRKGYIPYVAKENGKTYQLPVDLGPESVVVENVDLPYWYEGPQLTYLSSGFGPYALNRLVKETGGVYFMTNMTTNSELSTIGQFDAAIMKAFEPDYRYSSEPQFLKELLKNPLRDAVVGMAKYSQTTNLRQGTPTLEFRVQANNFRQQFADAQKSAAISSLAIDSILAKMPPNTEKLYASEQSPRWRLAFSLDYGRLLAQKVRAFEYNSALAQLKGTYTESDINTKVNHFIFRPDKELNYAPSVRKQAKIAEELLQRVIKDAPGTPWEMLAKRELKDGFGIRLVERFIPPPAAAPKADPGKVKPGPKILAEQQKAQPKAPVVKPVDPPLPKL